MRVIVIATLAAGLGCDSPAQIGFGVALTVMVESAISAAELDAARRLRVVPSGDESDPDEVTLDRPFARSERFVYRPRTGTRALTLAVELYDPEGLLAGGATEPRALVPGRTTFATVTLQKVRGAVDLGLADRAAPSDGPDEGDLAVGGDLAGLDLAGSTPDAPAAIPLYAHTQTNLYRINPTTLASTLVGGFGIASMTDIAVSATGQIYGCSFTDLYVVSPTTGAASLLRGNFLPTGPSGMANGLGFTGDGRLLAVDQPGAVYLVSLPSGVASAIGALGSGRQSAGDLAELGGVLYGLASSGTGASPTNNVLLRVDPSTGAGTPVGATGYGMLFGLAASGGKLFGFSGGDGVIEIDSASGAGTPRGNLLVWYGAGSPPQ